MAEAVLTLGLLIWAMSGRAAGRRVPELGYLSASTWVLSVMISISCASRSTLSLLMMLSFLLSSATWLVVLFTNCSTVISRRRVDIANSARRRSFSACTSAID